MNKNRKENNKVKDINEYKREKENIYKNRKQKKIMKKSTKIGIGILGVFLIVTNISIYSIAVNLKYEVNSLEKELKQKEREKTNLRVELDVLSKSGYIEEQAKERFDMVYPEGNQIKYIKIDK